VLLLKHLFQVLLSDPSLLIQIEGVEGLPEGFGFLDGEELREREEDFPLEG